MCDAGRDLLHGCRAQKITLGYQQPVLTGNARRHAPGSRPIRVQCISVVRALPNMEQRSVSSQTMGGNNARGLGLRLSKETNFLTINRSKTLVGGDFIISISDSPLVVLDIR